MENHAPASTGGSIWTALPLLLSLVALVGGCDGCKETASWTLWGIRTRSKVLIGHTCSFDKACPKTCPQGDVCRFYADLSPDAGVCECRSVWSKPCATASDCGPTPPGETCLWSCSHYPGSDVGSCECKANCHTALECGPIADCPEGPICAPFRWGDGARCACASKVPDGGMP